MRIILYFTLLLFLFGCGKNKKPNDLIPKDKLVDLLVDIHIFDAASNESSFKSIIRSSDSLTLYSSIFDKHKTSKEQFDSTMFWYTNNPEKLAKVYDNVFGTITRKEQELNEKLELFSSTKRELLFKTPKYIDTRGDTVYYPEPFFIKTKAAGTYLVDLKIRLLPDDASVNPRITAYFIDNDTLPTDSIKVINQQLIKSNFIRDYQSIIELKDDHYKFLKLNIPVIDNDSNTFRKNFQISVLKVSMLKEGESKKKKKK